MNYNLIVKDKILETYILTSKIYDNDLINNLINLVKEKKDNELSYKTHVKGHFTGFNSLNNNTHFVNFLKLIQPTIYLIYKNDFIISEAWGNMIKKGEEVTEHDHGDMAFCGILYLSDGGPGTYFRDHNLTINEEKGKFVLFHSSLLHSVQKINQEIERITIAFNMRSIKPWDTKNQFEWVNKKNEI
jgi:hypothetical protein